MPRTVTDRDAVLEAAGSLVDEHGAEQLTVAAVAEALGVAASGLYHHVDGIEALRAEIAVRTVESLDERLRDAAIGRAGAEAVAAVADAYRSFVADRAGRYDLAARTRGDDRPELQDAWRRVIELFVRVLEPFGLDPDQSVHAARALVAGLHGFVGIEQHQGFSLPQDVDESFTGLVDRFLTSLAVEPA